MFVRGCQLDMPACCNSAHSYIATSLSCCVLKHKQADLRVTKMGSVAATISWLVAAVSRSAQLAYRAPAVQLNWGKRSSAAAVYSTLWQTVNNLSGLLHVTGRQFVACLTSCMSYFLAMPGTFSVALRCEHAWVCICMLGILTFVMFAGG